MKRFFLLFGVLLFFSTALFAEDEGNNESDDDLQDIVYSMNGRGDQYIKIGIMLNFPMNFDDQLYLGGAANLGYYRFLNSWFGLGGELAVGYNPTLGSNTFTYVPITFGAAFQPTVWRFEFPITLSVGMAFETCQNKKYFPGFASKVEAGAFFRFNEGWSIGAGSELIYLPEWYTTTDNASSDYGLFLTAFIAVRYHF